MWLPVECRHLLSIQYEIWVVFKNRFTKIMRFSIILFFLGGGGGGGHVKYKLYMHT